MNSKNIQTAIVAAGLLLSCRAAIAQNTAAPKQTDPGGRAAIKSHYKPWPPMMENEIAKKVRIWEDISPGEKRNNYFHAGMSGKPLIDVLISGVQDGKITAYSAGDDRFTGKIAVNDFAALLNKDNISEPAESSHTAITKYIVKEDSLYMKDGRMLVRILGIAPVISVKGNDGSMKDETLFWIYYPDARSYFAEYYAAPPLSWNDVFEGRYFSGTVTKKLNK